jgi:hypothetical protein
MKRRSLIALAASVVFMPRVQAAPGPLVAPIDLRMLQDAARKLDAHMAEGRGSYTIFVHPNWTQAECWPQVEANLRHHGYLVHVEPGWSAV